MTKTTTKKTVKKIAPRKLKNKTASEIFDTPSEAVKESLSVPIIDTDNAKELVQTAQENKSTKVYKLFIQVNGVSHEVETTNLFDTIMSYKPHIVSSSMKIKVISPSGTVRDKYIFSVIDVRKIFNNKLTLEYLIKSLI
jgi:hypothetical protein